MKKKWITPSAIILIFTLVACEFAGVTIDFGLGGDSGGGSKNSVVETGVDSPINGSNLSMSPVDISYHASSTDGVSTVELSIDGAVVNSFTNPDSNQKIVALKFNWTPSQPGSHTIRVRAQSSTGAWSEFSASTVNVQEEQEKAVPAEPVEKDKEEEPSEPAEDKEDEKEKDGPPETDEVMIYELTHSADTFYYSGSGCNRENTITAMITNPEKVYYATVFIRLVDKEGAGLTDWDSYGNLSHKSGNKFSMTIFSENIPNWSLFDFAVMEYQIVIRDKKQNDLFRSEVMRDISLEICQS